MTRQIDSWNSDIDIDNDSLEQGCVPPGSMVTSTGNGGVCPGVSAWVCVCPGACVQGGVHPLDPEADTPTPLHAGIRLLNIRYISNETNIDVHMYIEEFILVEIWIHCCTNWN